ncbi:MAG TPA: ATP-dependent Clp protease ATP-binding subunit ClpA, partial [Hyphomonas atlantica]|nr:ATP-dependent Clp protease ATP-binding subunit ClpA [Hyphomonas atlantica]
FTPEFRNRLDATITFGGLTPEIIDRVVEKFILQLEVQLEDRNVSIEITKPAREWLAKRGFDADMGARPLARTIQEHVKKPMAEELLFGELQKGGVVYIDIDKADDEKLAFKYVAEKPKKKKPAAKKGSAEEPA